MLKFELNLSGLRTIRRRAERLGAGMSKSREYIYDRWTQSIYDIIQTSFRKQGSPWGVSRDSAASYRKWPDLKESTKKTKKSEVGFVYPILQRKKDYVNSFQISKTRGNAKVYTKTEYAEYHEFGTRKIQARRVMPTEEAASKIATYITKEYHEKVKREAGI